MFRIKTDIRQYKCETKDKVEKLIRNWVIRPNDLIYDQDENTWEPIGDHPSFTNVFTMLAETEAGTPDTVVSKKPKKEGEEEVTNVAERPDFEDSEASEGEDSRATDIFDHEEIIRTLPDDAKTEKPKPPEAPEGVEPPRQDDEVTMMTDKTFDMLAEEAVSEVTEDSEAVEEEPPEEEPEDDEDTGVKEKPQKPNGVQSDLSLGDAESDPTIVETQETPEEKEDAEEGDTPVDAPKLGRHDLPEEFFATNEITTVNREDVEKRDDLNETASEASEVDEEWEQLVDDFRAVEELASEASEAADPNESPALRDTDELDRPPEPTLQEDLDEISDSFDEPDEDPDAEDSEAEEEPPEHIDGYLIPAPFNVGPTAEDMKLGLKRTKMSQARKLAAFPDPKQKEYKDPIIRNFDRTPPIPKDYTVLMVFGCIFLFGFVLFLISQC